MYLAKLYDGRVKLGRCGCSHSWGDDTEKYGSITNKIHGEYRVKVITCELDFCSKCDLNPWTIEGLDEVELRRRDRI